MTSPSEALNLDNLPPDVIRKIISLGLNDIDTMKLISPQWRVLVIENYRNRTNAPVIKYLSWRSGYAAGKTETMLKMHVPGSLRKYFGAQNWHSSPIPNGSMHEYSYDGKSRRDVAMRIIEIAKRCSRIERLDICKMNRDQYAMHTIKFAMKDLIVDELYYGQIHGYENIESELKNLVELAQEVKSVWFFRQLVAGYPYAFISILPNLVRVVPTIELVVTELNDLEALLGAMRPPGTDEWERGYWNDLKDQLNNNEHLTARLHTEARPSGACYRLTVTAKEASS